MAPNEALAIEQLLRRRQHQTGAARPDCRRGGPSTHVVDGSLTDVLCLNVSKQWNRTSMRHYVAHGGELGARPKGSKPVRSAPLSPPYQRPVMPALPGRPWNRHGLLALRWRGWHGPRAPMARLHDRLLDKQASVPTAPWPMPINGIQADLREDRLEPFAQLHARQSQPAARLDGARHQRLLILSLHHLAGRFPAWRLSCAAPTPVHCGSRPAQTPTASGCHLLDP